jgi:hypothetical protein
MAVTESQGLVVGLETQRQDMEKDKNSRAIHWGRFLC